MMHIESPSPLTGEGGGEGENGFFPLPFTLLDRILYLALLSRMALSNRVNPLPPGEGKGFCVIFFLTEV